MEFIIDYALIAPDVLESIISSRTNGVMDYFLTIDIDEDCYRFIVDSFDDYSPLGKVFALVEEIVEPYLFKA